MCGVGGFYLKNSFALEGVKFLLRSICQKQNHRGPDSNGYWIDNDKKIGLTHNRLSILDLSELASQPLKSRDKTCVLSFNGEIYNWRALRVELEAKGVVFSSCSDSEVIVEGYQVWGVEVVKKLRGMFSFAIWDNKKKQLFCARDKVGKKPFLYAESDLGFFFASEIPALRSISQAAHLDMEIDRAALSTMLVHNLRHIPDPRTVYKGIRRLRPGHALIVRKGIISRCWRYYDPVSLEKNISHDDLLNIFEESVHIRCDADVPIGAFLSGGIDSTAIVSMMKKKFENRIHTYAFGMNEKDEDILRARRVAKKLNTQHKEIYFDRSKQLHTFRKMIGIYGEPLMLLPLVHAYELSRVAREDGIKVIMNGSGADELFYGYLGHERLSRVNTFLRIAQKIRFVDRISCSHFSSFAFKSPGERKAELYKYKSIKCWDKVLLKEAALSLCNTVSDELSYWGKLVPNDEFIDEFSYLSFFVENAHSLTIANDLPGMMSSIEIRSPFMDENVISASMAISHQDKVCKVGKTFALKHIMKEALHSHVPSYVLRASKRGFGNGIQEKNILLDFWTQEADEVFHDFPCLDIFDKNLISELWAKSKRTRRGPWDLLSKLFAIGTWSNMT